MRIAGQKLSATRLIHTAANQAASQEPQLIHGLKKDLGKLSKTFADLHPDGKVFQKWLSLSRSGDLSFTPPLLDPDFEAELRAILDQRAVAVKG